MPRPRSIHDRALRGCALAVLVLALVVPGVARGDQAVREVAGVRQNPEEPRETDDSGIRLPPSNNPYCGIYSLLACMHALGKPVDARELIAVEYVGSHRGSSARELVRAAEDHNLHARAWSGLTHRELARAGNPMVLHTRSPGGDDFDHWVAFLGFEGVRVRILDPPRATDTMTQAELLAVWDGLVIEVSDEPLTGSVVREARVDYLLTALVIVSLIYGVRLLARRQTTRSADGNARRVAMQAGSLVGAACLAAVAWHSMTEVGFLRNRSAVAEVQRRHFSADFPEVSLAEVQRVIAADEAVLVDARFARDYHSGHVAGAVSVPIDSNLPQLTAALGAIPRDRPIIVYCQTDRCDFSDRIAEVLKFNGYNDVSIYREGYREWSQHVEGDR